MNIKGEKDNKNRATKYNNIYEVRYNNKMDLIHKVAKKNVI
jgi:hypothetical protein